MHLSSENFNFDCENIIYYNYVNRLRDFPEVGSSNPARARKQNVHCNLSVRVDCEINVISVPPLNGNNLNFRRTNFNYSINVNKFSDNLVWTIGS